MQRLAHVLLLLLVLSRQGYGQDTPVKIKGGDTKVVMVDHIVVTKVPRLVVTTFPFDLEVDPNKGFYDWLLPEGVKGIEADNVLKVTAAPKGDLSIRVKVRSAKFVEGQEPLYITKYGTFDFSVGDVGPQPVPPGPTPTPVPPTPSPVPVKSFRVIFVYETSKTLTKEQNSAMYGKLVRDYLSANTTPENGLLTGYRYWDKDTDASLESPTLKALWAAITPQLVNTSLPLVAVEVNGKVELIPVASSDKEMFSILKKYKEGQ